MKASTLALFGLALFTLSACDNRPGITTSQSAGGASNAPESERSPNPGASASPSPQETR